MMKQYHIWINCTNLIFNSFNTEFKPPGNCKAGFIIAIWREGVLRNKCSRTKGVGAGKSKCSRGVLALENWGVSRRNIKLFLPGKMSRNYCSSWQNEVFTRNDIVPPGKMRCSIDTWKLEEKMLLHGKGVQIIII